MKMIGVTNTDNELVFLNPLTIMRIEPREALFSNKKYSEITFVNEDCMSVLDDTETLVRRIEELE